MQLSNSGQVTIPPDIRALAGLMPGSEVEFQFDNGRLWLTKVPTSALTQRQQVLALIDQVKGCATANLDMQTDAIMQLTRGD
jgi:bifunctional DNA-binding transcriptional regulator/antitoxin component of YhaV-PrlF toxin-antitoxin module